MLVIFKPQQAIPDPEDLLSVVGRPGEKQQHTMGACLGMALGMVFPGVPAACMHCLQPVSA